MPPRSRGSSRVWLARVAWVGLAAMLLGASPAHADDYESQQAGHPLRLAAYVLHPVGVILDTLIARPAHWLVSRESMRTLFGHEESPHEAAARSGAYKHEEPTGD